MISAACGYTIAKFPFRGRELLFSVILGGVLVPATVIALPLNRRLARAHLVHPAADVRCRATGKTRGKADFQIHPGVTDLPFRLLEHQPGQPGQPGYPQPPQPPAAPGGEPPLPPVPPTTPPAPPQQ